jgi:hypothetical protein
MWIPLVLVGSILFWTVALGLGRMSLSLLGDTSDEELVNCPGSRSISAVTNANAVILPQTHGAGPVEVQIISRGSGGNHAIDDGTGRLPAIDDSPQPLIDDSAPQAPTLDDPPGRTSY